MTNYRIRRSLMHPTIILAGLAGLLVTFAPTPSAQAGRSLKLPYCAIPEIKSSPLTKTQRRQFKEYLRNTKGEGFRLYNASNTSLYVEVNGSTYQLLPRKERYITGRGRKVEIVHPRSFNNLGDRSRSFRVYPGTEKELSHVLYRKDNNRVGTCFTVRAV